MKLSAPIAAAAAVLLLLSPLSAPAAHALALVLNADGAQPQSAQSQPAGFGPLDPAPMGGISAAFQAQPAGFGPLDPAPMGGISAAFQAQPAGFGPLDPAPMGGISAAFQAQPAGFGPLDPAPIGGISAAFQAQPAGFGPLDPAPPLNGLTPAALIAKFGERESAFAKARNEYTFRQSVRVDTISDDTNRPDGTYQQVTDIVFDANDHRTERVVSAPANTLERLIMTQADFDDIAHRLPFVLTTPELPQYNLTYLGRQRVDDIDTYVFDCKPRTIEKGKRYFQGRVWVDQQQYEIVLINGKSVPDILKRGHEDLSPPYTTYYQEVDGGNWFPVYTKADGILHFPADTGSLPQDVHIRYVVRYEDYKRFHAKSRIIYNGETLPDAAPGTQPPATTQPEATPPPAPTNPLPPPDPDAPALKRPPTKPQ